MKDQLSMFDQTNLTDIPSVISSLESESGPMRSDSQAGQTTAKSGPDHVPASHLAKPVKGKRSATKDIFGQNYIGSSKHSALSFALASRLHQGTDLLGSTLFSLTWTVRITPAGRSIYALRASALRIGGSVCIGPPNSPCSTVMMRPWPTPDAQLFNLGCDTQKHQDRMDRLKETHHNGNGAGETLGYAAMLSAWQTPHCPRQHDSDMSESTYLGREARLAGWSSPIGDNATDSRYTYAQGDHNKITLKLPGEAQLTAIGPGPIGYLLGPSGWRTVPASGRLSPAHSRYLMGLPKGWDDCGVTAMASLPKRRKHL